MSPKKLKAGVFDHIAETYGSGHFIDEHGGSIFHQENIYSASHYKSFETVIRISDGHDTVSFTIRAEGETPAEILECARKSERAVAELVRELQRAHTRFAEKAADFAIKVGSDS